MKKLRIIVGGYIGLLPAGGISWDYAQYPVGLAELGHDVYYIEDTRLYPAYTKDGGEWNDASFCVEYLQSVMDFFGMSERWAYRDEASGKCFGLSEEKVLEIAKTADVFINVSCSTVMRDEYERIPARILIDSDPMFTQLQYLSEQTLTPGEPSMRTLVDAHNFHFTFGENIGAADCRIPDCGLNWRPTRQPVCLDYWKNELPNANAYFSTLMNWAAAKTLDFDGEHWGQKDIEFQRFMRLPKAVLEAKFAVAVGQTRHTGHADFPANEVEKNNWLILNPNVCAGNLTDYQNFIADSLGEFSIAKETYVKGRTGWFSCRSACYLASGRTVITQETGWSRIIPTGNGLFSFTTQEEAIEAIKKALCEPEKHSRAARQIAEEYFDSRMILNELLEQIL